jgi:hypothetical protein
MADYFRIIPAFLSTAGAQPSADDLQTGELALNQADGTLWTKNSDGAIVQIGAQANSATATDAAPTFQTVSASGDYGIFTGPAAMGGVTRISASCVSGEVRLAWSQFVSECSDPVVEYVVQQRAPGTSAWNDVFHLSPTEDSLLLRDPAANSSYRVQAVSSTGSATTSDSVAIACTSYSCSNGTCSSVSLPPDSASGRYATVGECQALCQSLQTCIDVDSTLGWQLHPIAVGSSTPVTISAAGTATWKHSLPDNTADPNGIIGPYSQMESAGCNAGISFMAAKHMALIGRWGASGTPFFVGAGPITVTSPAPSANWGSGLYLRVNDTCQNDNSGSFRACAFIASNSNPAP